MRICDICRNECGLLQRQVFETKMAQLDFLVTVSAFKGNPPFEYDLCKDCAAKAALAALAVNPTEPKKEP